METILIWLGSGFAFAVGVVFGAFLMRSVLKNRSDSTDRQTELMQASADLLKERNDIGRETAATMNKIFYCLDEMLAYVRKDAK